MNQGYSQSNVVLPGEGRAGNRFIGGGRYLFENA